MSQAFQDIVRFKHFTGLNLFKHAFNVIQNWETDALFDGPYYLLAVMVKEDESSLLRIANLPAVLASYWPLLTTLNMENLSGTAARV